MRIWLLHTEHGSCFSDFILVFKNNLKNIQFHQSSNKNNSVRTWLRVLYFYFIATSNLISSSGDFSNPVEDTQRHRKSLENLLTLWALTKSFSMFFYTVVWTTLTQTVTEAMTQQCDIINNCRGCFIVGNVLLTYGYPLERRKECALTFATWILRFKKWFEEKIFI